ncbi:MAG: TIGR02710 family CRISPR-associated protein, partial [Thermomicrobium sp.]|nr:TIGR02710 family CRISPR-associated protein [Thermomicrobium sp.]
PEQLRSEYASRADRDRPLTLALVPAWDLLARLPDEPLADWLRAERGRLLEWTRHRNASLLAHGFQPVTETVWRRDGRRGIELCRAGLRELAGRKLRPKRLSHQQFPRAELLSELA